MFFDHVILGVVDLDAATEGMQREHGLVVAGDGVHPGGTKNRAVRFSDGSYVELLAVADAAGPNGVWLESVLAGRDRLIGWAVRTTDIDAVAARLGMTPRAGSVTSSDGRLGTWRNVGGPGKGDRPFFIQYDDRPSQWPGQVEGGIERVEVAGDPVAVRAWLGDTDLDVRVTEGPPALLTVVIKAGDREIVLR